MSKPVTVRVEQDVPARMRDGTVLYSDVYRPDTPGRYPTILCRTPYDKDAFSTRVDSVDPIRAARQGYAFVMQNVRGRYNSEGTFYTFKNEINDGYDTVEWAASQILVLGGGGDARGVVCRGYAVAGGDIQASAFEVHHSFHNQR